jgi:hypothetical protein
MTTASGGQSTDFWVPTDITDYPKISTVGHFSHLPKEVIAFHLQRFSDLEPIIWISLRYDSQEFWG